MHPAAAQSSLLLRYGEIDHEAGEVAAQQSARVKDPSSAPERAAATDCGCPKHQFQTTQLPVHA